MTLGPGLQVTRAQGSGLLTLVDMGDANEDLVQVDATGVVIGRTSVGDAGAVMVVDGNHVWLLSGLAIEDWALVHPVP